MTYGISCTNIDQIQQANIPKLSFHYHLFGVIFEPKIDHESQLIEKLVINDS